VCRARIGVPGAQPGARWVSNLLILDFPHPQAIWSTRFLAAATVAVATLGGRATQPFSNAQTTAKSGRSGPHRGHRGVVVWMRQTVRSVLVLSFALWAGGCGSSGVPTLPAPPLQTASTEPPATAPSGQAAPVEAATVVPGTPTDVYALVARGALGCWFAPNGPLKTTHVFHAEARPPAQGGTAEIVVHERDATMRDQRGPRALRILFEAAPGGVRVVTTNVRITSPLSELVARDVETWARGGVSCQARVEAPPPASAPSTTAKGTSTGRRR
jgi:hypothetical protein